MTTVQVELPGKLIPVFTGEADYRCSWGGRGSAKTRTFAKQAAVRGLMYAQRGVSGLIACGREIMKSLDESSFAEVKAAILSVPWLAAAYDIGEKFIRTREHFKGRVDFAFVGLRHNLGSIKSKARILLLWVDEAEEVSEKAWLVVEGTLREEGDDWYAELWVTWNPERHDSPTNNRFRLNPPPNWKGAEMNWRDNEFFPQKLNRTRLTHKVREPDDYDWVWEGAYRTHFKGAYYAKHLTLAKAQGRIGTVDLEPLMSVRTYHDLAGASDRADAYSIWVTQFINNEIRILDHYETEGQDPSYHVNWLREWCLDRGVASCRIGLPHDASQVQINQSWERIWQMASSDEVKFRTHPCQSGEKGAAMNRVRASRLHFHRVRFNAETTEAGRRSLGAYHEKRSEDDRNIGLGPNHNWASHSADAFGLMCIDYAETKNEKPKNDDYKFASSSESSGWAW
jgi:phage terminase large subunit